MFDLAALSTLGLLSVPLFVVLLSLEVFWAKRSGLPYHDLRETVASLACGVGEQAVSLLITVPLFVGYNAVERLAPVHLSASSPWTWLGAAVLMDFLYYWYHRAGHQIGFIWALHVVHHQSRDFNLSVALRNSLLGKVVQMMFTIPLALMGVPVVVLVILKTLMNLYMFLQHTRAVGPLGFIEKIFVTPSSHRVHHALNARFVDHNYGGVLIIWDRLLGTYQEEDEPCLFHDVPDHPGYDPLWANLVGWVSLGEKLRATESWRRRLALLFGLPEIDYQAVTAGRPQESSAGLSAYAYAQMIAVLPLLALGHKGSLLADVSIVAAVFAGLVAPGALLDGLPWAVRAERLRLLGMLLACCAALLLGAEKQLIGLLLWAAGSLVLLAALLGQAPKRGEARAA